MGEQLRGVVLRAGDAGLGKPLARRPRAASRSAGSVTTHAERLEPRGHVGLDARGDHGVEVAVEHAVEVVGLVAGAVVGDPVLRRSCRCGSARSGRRCAPGSGGRRWPRRWPPPAAAASSRARRIRIACSRFCSWDFSFWQLTTMPVGRWVIRTAESVVFTLWPPGPLERKTSMRRSLSSICDVDRLGLGQHQDAGGAGVHPALALGDRHPLDAVHPALELQQGVRRLARRGVPLAFTASRHRLVAAEVGLGGVEHLDRPAAPLGPAGVHPQQVAGEQRRLLAALPRLDLEQHVLAVGRVARDQQVAQPLLGDAARRGRAAPPRRRSDSSSPASSRAASTSSPRRVHSAWACDDRAQLGVPLVQAARQRLVGVRPTGRPASRSSSACSASSWETASNTAAYFSAFSALRRAAFLA